MQESNAVGREGGRAGEREVGTAGERGREEREREGCGTERGREGGSDETRPRGRRFHMVSCQKLFQIYQF